MRHEPRSLSLLTICAFLFLIDMAAAAVTPQPGDFQGCPPPGQGGDPDMNRLKNRAEQPTIVQSMTVAQINALPLPLETLRGKRATWPASTRQEVSALEQQGVVVEGFLIGAKQSGTETTNCKRKDLRDYHLWVTDGQQDTRASAVVVEVTPQGCTDEPNQETPGAGNTTPSFAYDHSFLC